MNSSNRPSPDVWRIGPPFSSKDGRLYRGLTEPIASFLRLEAATGVLLLVASVSALAWVNSPWGETYERFLGLELGFSLGGEEVSHDCATGSTTD